MRLNWAHAALLDAYQRAITGTGCSAPAPNEGMPTNPEIPEGFPNCLWTGARLHFLGPSSTSTGDPPISPGTSSMLDFAQARRMMVDSQLRTFDVNALPLLAAMDAVPRELFVARGR